MKKYLMFTFLSLFISVSAIAQEKERVQDESDTRIAEYVSGATDKQGEVTALIVSQKITAEKILDSDNAKQFSAIEKRIDFVMAPNEEVKSALAKKIKSDIVIPEKTFMEATQTDIDISWMIVTANGPKLGRVLASGFLDNIIEPLSESDKPQE